MSLFKFRSNGRQKTAISTPKPTCRLAIALFILAAGAAHAGDFSVPFKPLKPDVIVAEVGWQMANVVDLQQTLRGSEDPARFREVGTLKIFCGYHPTTRQVWIGSLAFGLAHYAVTQAFTSLGWTAAARIWSYGSLGVKLGNIRRNEEIGLGY